MIKRIQRAYLLHSSPWHKHLEQISLWSIESKAEKVSASAMYFSSHLNTEKEGNKIVGSIIVNRFLMIPLQEVLTKKKIAYKRLINEINE
jgi:hypothetical protein